MKRVAALLTLCALASPLSAQQPSVSELGDPAGSFEQLLEEGLRLREQGNDAEALDRFERCLILRPSSGQAFGQVAFAEMALGRLVLADVHLSAALRNSDDWVRRHRSALTDARASIRARLGTVFVPTIHGMVTFEESGQTRVLATPVNIQLSPGRHVIRVGAPGHDRSMAILNIEPGQSITHDPQLQPTRGVPVDDIAPQPGPAAHGPLIETTIESEDPETDPARYLVRSIRLDISAALFATGALATGIAAVVTRPYPDAFGARAPRTLTNTVLISTAIGTALVAFALFIGARTTRARHRRENSMPSF